MSMPTAELRAVFHQLELVTLQFFMHGNSNRQTLGGHVNAYS
jgi:hypothetical protein